MYIPSAFEITRIDLLHDFIEQHSFGVLVSQTDEGPFASHLPFLLDRNSGKYGTLSGHIARANPHWRQLKGQDLAIFSGPHAYISPTWYDAPQTVPTWNYLAVHVTGRAETFAEPEELMKVLQGSVDKYEKSMPEPWSFDPSSEFANQKSAQIVGFRMQITKIEGIFKLNQNYPVAQRKNVIAALLRQTSDNARQVAQAMESTLP